MTTTKLKDLLKASNDGGLGDIVQRAQTMGELTDVLSRALPRPDRAAIVAANVRADGEMIVICASSAWAARLRFKTELLIKAAREAGVAASTCRVRVSQG